MEPEIQNSMHHNNASDGEDEDEFGSFATRATPSALKFKKKTTKKKMKMKMKVGNLQRKLQVNVPSLGLSEDEGGGVGEDSGTGRGDEEEEFVVKKTETKVQFQKKKSTNKGGKTSSMDFLYDQEEEEDRDGGEREPIASSNVKNGISKSEDKVRKVKTRTKTTILFNGDDNGLEDEDEGQGFSYSTDNLKKLLHSQRAKSQALVEQAEPSEDQIVSDLARVEISQDTERLDTDIKTDAGANTVTAAATILAANDSKDDDADNIQVYDDKTIEHIKAKKLYLRSKLAQQAERNAVVGNYVGASTTKDGNAIDIDAAMMNGSSDEDSNISRDRNSNADDVLNQDEIRLDVGDSSDESDSGGPATNSVTFTRSATKLDTEPVSKKVQFAKPHFVGGSGEDIEETEFRDARLQFDPTTEAKVQELEIKDAIYEYDIEHGNELDEDEEVMKWENERILNAIKMGTGSNKGPAWAPVGDYGISALLAVSHEEALKNVISSLSASAFERSFREFPKTSAVYENYANEKRALFNKILSQSDNGDNESDEPRIAAGGAESRQRDREAAAQNKASGLLYEKYIGKLEECREILGTLVEEKLDKFQEIKFERDEVARQREAIQSRIDSLVEQYKDLEV